jgi:hypothetical protein
MNTYSIVLFLHIVGALGFFIALGLEWTGLSQIRSATALDQIRGWMGILKNLRKVSFASMLTAVITGIFMFLTVWRRAPWIYVTLGSLILVIVISAALSASRMAEIGQSLFREKIPLSQNFHNLASDPVLMISIQTRAAITLGIVFLKIAKPDWAGSLLIIGVAIVFGLASALPVSRRQRSHVGSTD